MPESSKKKEDQYFQSLKDHFANLIGEYMEENQIGFNEMYRRLGTSAEQLSKVLKKKSNLSIKFIAKIYALIGFPECLSDKKSNSRNKSIVND